MQLWAIEETFLVRFLETILNASSEEVRASLADELSAPPPSIVSTNNGVASIRVEGPLTQAGPSALARLFGFGGTSYRQIEAAVSEAAADPSIRSLRLEVDSPGGEVQGVDNVYNAVVAAAASKPVVAVNRGMMASAAYWLSAGATEIVAESPGVETGSIGVVVTAVDTSGADKLEGISRVRIVSRSAPNKAPDVGTSEGRSVLQDRADALERVFIQRVAEGRGIDVETVENTFGNGGLLIAADPGGSQPDALKTGMIDRVLYSGPAELDAPRGSPSGGISSPTGAHRWGASQSNTQKSGLPGDTSTRTPQGVRPAGPVLNRSAERADAQLEKGNEMTIRNLADALEEVPGIGAELDQLKTEARADLQSRIDAASPYLTADYPDAVKALAVGVLKGEKNPAALEGAVVALDAMRESAKVTEAVAETTKQGPTPATPASPVAEDGSIGTEGQYQAEVAAYRQARGMKES